MSALPFSVIRVLGIQFHLCFPFIRHAVLVRVFGRRLAFELWPAAHFVLAVDEVMRSVVLVALFETAAAERGMPVAAAEEEVVMQRHVAGGLSQRHQHRVTSLVVSGFVQGLSVDRPLQCEVREVFSIHGPIHTPGRGDMVENHVTDVFECRGHAR